MPLAFDFVCPLTNGVHARPAGALEEVLRNFKSEVTLTNRRSGQTANAKSVLAIVSADIRESDACHLDISGPDEADALTAVSRFLTKAFPHCDDSAPPASLLPGNHQALLPSILLNTTATIRRGLPVVGGVGSGEIVPAGGLRLPDTIPLTGAGDANGELAAIDKALISLASDYEKRLTPRASSLEKDLLKTHQSIARDPEFRAQLQASVMQPNHTAAAAIAATEKYFTSRLAASDNALMRERVLDIQDVCFQLLGQVYGKEAIPGDIPLSDDSILLAETLTPGQFLRLDHTKLRGLVLGHAGTTSHTVILARSFGIPTLAGVGDFPSANLRGQDAIVDGDAGLFITNLTESVRKYYTAEQRRLSARREYQRRFKARPAATSDGHRIEIAANIATAQETATAFAEGAEAIGLFRTEMLFLDRDKAPSEEEQFKQYKSTLLAAGDRTVIMRAVDIGGDKPLAYLNLPTEENPFLGYRAVRIYPEFETLFRTQIRALVRASAHGRLKVMIPMVSNIGEVRWVKQVVQEEQKRCAESAIAFDKNMPVGAMIEVPAATFLLDKLCAELDFFSIGSNDLAQFFVAADRGDSRLTQLHDRLQPAFLRLLKKVVDEIHTHGKKVGICGEMGAQPECLPLLVGLGLDEISVAPAAVPIIKAALATWSISACRGLVHRALDCFTADQVRTMVENDTTQRSLPLVEPELIVVEASCQSKTEAISQAVELLYAAGRTDKPREVEQAILQREATYSTGFGHGFAIPHCKSDSVLANSLAILKLRTPVDWESLDQQPVNVIILMAIREADQANGHMKILSQLARKVMDENFREHIARESDPIALCAFLKASLNA